MITTSLPPSGIYFVFLTPPLDEGPPTYENVLRPTFSMHFDQESADREVAHWQQEGVAAFRVDFTCGDQANSTVHYLSTFELQALQTLAVFLQSLHQQGSAETAQAIVGLFLKSALAERIWRKWLCELYAAE